MKKILSRTNETKVRSPRINIFEKIIVDSKTIGTLLSYPLVTENVSSSGLLLKWSNKNLRVPFLENTIIEMVIDRERIYFAESVKCLGKVVRSSEEDDGRETKYGVRIVQIDSDVLETWEGALKEMEKVVA